MVSFPGGLCDVLSGTKSSGQATSGHLFDDDMFAAVQIRGQWRWQGLTVV